MTARVMRLGTNANTRLLVRDSVDNLLCDMSSPDFGAVMAYLSTHYPLAEVFMMIVGDQPSSPEQ